MFNEPQIGTDQGLPQPPVDPAEAPIENQAPDIPVDPWITAFDQIAEQDTEDPKGDEGEPESQDPSVPPAPEPSAPQQAPGAPQDPAIPPAVEPPGGSVPVPSGTTEEHGTQPAPSPDVQAQEIKQQVNQIARQVKDQAKQDAEASFLHWTDPQTGRLMVRQNNGQLGASVNDPDIYIVKEDGTAEFRNPETGEIFEGDNPRAKAQQWVDMYNKELNDAIARETKARQDELAAEFKPQVDLIRFAPTYEALDPTRRAMLDGIIKDYEVMDAQGNHIGYSCNLKQALAQVDRQVKLIQAHQQAQAAPAAPAPGQPPAPQAPAATPAAHPHPAQQPVTGAPTSPAMNMPTGAQGGDGQLPPPKNVAEAMLRQQDALIAEMQAKDAKRGKA